jgi:Fe-coproporphyrin III synthase
VSPTGRAVFQIHPTRRCNLACKHCYSQSGPDVVETLEVDTVLAAVCDAAALGYQVLGVSGGEPLLYRALPEILDCAQSLGMTTTVTTNAMLLTDEWVQRLAGRVDVLAVSVDGKPSAHVEMRQHPNAFTSMERNVARLKDSGIPFGVITTLTQFNVDHLAWVADFALLHGASLLQVHPLELIGNAVTHLATAVPDVIELLYAAVETVRLRSLGQLHVQFDINAKDDIARQPKKFFVGTDLTTEQLGDWLSPLVLEASGRVVPLTYGFGDRYSLGVFSAAKGHSLRDLAQQWDPTPFFEHARKIWSHVTSEDAPALCNWYEEMTRTTEPAGPAERTEPVGVPVLIGRS